MAAMNLPVALTAVLCVVFLLPIRIEQAQQPPPTDELYAQSVTAMLDRAFPSPRVEYLVLDPRTERIIAMRWPHAEAPIPVGSLLKPFVALAFAELHGETAQTAQFPIVVCHGKVDGCWHAAGHGRVLIERALAESCNAYFLALGRSIAIAGVSGTEAVNRVSRRYGLPGPPTPITPGTLIGLDARWRIPPVTLARAYAALAAGSQPLSDLATATVLLTGMRLAAEPGGTASRIGPRVGGVLAKTGTAPCVADANFDHGRCAVNGDGLTVLLSPAERPQLLLLVRERGTTGAQAAETAGRMLTCMQHVEAHDACR